MTAVSTESQQGSRCDAGSGVPPEVASFYHLAAGDVRQCACQGLACFVARHSNPHRWQEATCQTARVYCLGKCFAAPAHGAEDVRPACHVDAREAIVLRRIMKGGARTIDAYRRDGGYKSLEEALRRSPEVVVQAVEVSGLRGRGGAAFPTGRKWRATAQQGQTPKYVVANADEGDAGAYIDRFILEDDPHCIVEGMLIAAHAVGASRGYIYLRCEYPAARVVLENAIAEARSAGLLGPHILGSQLSFDIDLHVGQGSYVCGEETALLRSIEGQRPYAMARPPYASEAGLFGMPTVINNVETLASIPWIVGHGGEAYHEMGLAKSRGTKVLSLNSLFNRPGLYEVELGISVRRIVEDLGGGVKNGTLKGLIIGGPLAGVIPPHLLDTPLGFEELRAIGASVGHGGVVAFDESTSIAQLVRHVFAFGGDESCGKCIPCRLGSRRIERMFDHLVAGRHVAAEERQEYWEIIEALAATSLCGLGGGLAEFAQSIARHYRAELDACFA